VLLHGAAFLKDFLIFTSAGDSANIKQWFVSERKNYDIWVTNYSSTSLLNKEFSDHYNERKGSKFQNLKHIFETERELLSHYKAIMVLDDDIIISPQSLSRLFTTLVEFDLWMLHPAFSKFGRISHQITARQLSTKLRYTNYIEVGCPIFRTDKLFDFLSVYESSMSSCYGLDYWFSHHFGLNVEDKYAISDRDYCINPYEQFKSSNGREINSLNSPAEREGMWEDIKQRMGIDNFKSREYSRLSNPLLKRVTSLPRFTAEVVFSFLLESLIAFKQKFKS